VQRSETHRLHPHLGRWVPFHFTHPTLLSQNGGIIKRFVFLLMPLLILALALGATGCYWADEDIGEKSALKVTLQDYCFAEESVSPEYSEVLTVSLSFENVGDSALYFDYYDFLYIAGDTESCPLFSGGCRSCPPVNYSFSPRDRTYSRSLKPRQTCSCQFQFPVLEPHQLPRDVKLTLVVYGEDSTGQSAVVEFRLPKINDMRRCTAGELEEGL